MTDMIVRPVYIKDRAVFAADHALVCETSDEVVGMSASDVAAVIAVCLNETPRLFRAVREAAELIQGQLDRGLCLSDAEVEWLQVWADLLPECPKDVE